MGLDNETIVVTSVQTPFMFKSVSSFFTFSTN